MGERMRALDWSKTPLGPPQGWPQSLKTIVRMMLDSRYAMWMLWGPELTFFCNDAYAPTLGIKRDWALGAQSDKVWEEIWPDIGPRIAQVLEHGRATWDEALLLFLERSGFPEETYHTFSYSPVYDDGNSIVGMLCVVTEVTERVIGERRLRLLRDLAARSVGAPTVEKACRGACEVLEKYSFSMPFAAIYVLDEGHTARRMAYTRGLPEHVAPAVLEESESSGWLLAQLIATEATQHIRGAREVGIHVTADPWPDLIRDAFLLPLKGSGGERLAGFLFAGVSPRRALDEAYRAFFGLVAGQIASAIADAQATEAERRRAEALAEIDRAKTAFFSNVSHEFRTPLTLMLGPLAEVAADPKTPALARARLDLAHRNSLRLLKLVNSLLDFSRIEAGRVLASYEPTDFSALTSDLSSTFRSAIERAGLRFDVQCTPLDEPAYVDREMWEKIVLNLLSNAFKYTLGGTITVRLRKQGGRAILEVIDTGVGIPAHALPHLFERFYRVEGTAGRTQEGSGIGLALVHELVRLHGGTIEVESELDRGTTFRVRVPLGTEHLPPDRIKAARMRDPTVAGAKVFVEEALRWIPSHADEAAADSPALIESSAYPLDGRFAETAGARIILADDNADMRAYVSGLLSSSYAVEIVADGEQALEAARRELPELILSDIMMPRLDGLALLKALRADERLCGVPVILLSARAGEEARLEGLEAGADDYLVKPFSARELLARVGALLELTRMRRENEERFHAFVSATSEVIYRMSPDWHEMRHLHGRNFIADTVDPSRTWLDRYLHPDDQPRVMTVIEEAIRTKSIFQLEHRVRRVDGTLGWVFSRAIPLKDGKGNIIEWFGAMGDVTERKETEQALREREEQLRLATEAAEVGLWDVDSISDKLFWPPRVKAMFGISPEVSVSMADFYAGLHPADRQRTTEAFAAAVDSERRALYDVEYRTVGKEDGLTRWVAAKGRGIFDGSGKCVRVIGTAIDITARKRAEERLREEARVQELLGKISHALVGAQLDTERVVQIATDAATELSGAAFGAFFYNVQDQKGEWYTLFTLSGAPREAFARFPQPRNTGVFGPTFRGEGVVRSSDITADSRYGHNAPYQGMPEGHLPVRSYLAVPVKTVSGQVLGGLFFGHPAPGVFDERAERLVLAIAAQAAVAFDNARLHQASQWEIEQRKHAEEALSEADRRKDEFLAMLAHELRNPLSPIMTAGELLSRTIGEDSRSRMAIEMIKRQTAQLTRLVDDLLDVSRITRGRIQLQRRPTDLASIIAQALETVEPQLRAKQHRLSTTAESYEPLYVSGDHARLLQCVANVLTNSIKYTDPGGEIRIQTRTVGDSAVIEITDTGVGIGPELLPKVFDLFVQSDRTLDRAQGGLGIGLAVVKRLIEMHDGQVTARSPGLGGGSTFEIRLPRVVRPRASSNEAAQIKGPPRRVLIVDDNQDAANSLAALLACHGHEAQVAFTGKQALEQIESFQPEVALLDLGLPEMDGYELAGRLRALPRLNGIRLVALTGYGQAEDGQRTQAAGFHDHLVKPVALQALERALAAIPARRSERKDEPG
jgi:PAS domain S-box-containing protein